METLYRTFRMSIRDSSATTVYEDLGSVVFGLPIMDISSTDLVTLWTTMLPEHTTEIYNFFNTIVGYCGGFIRQPWCWPGVFAYNGDLSIAGDFDRIAPYFPTGITSTWTPSGSSNRIVFAVDGNNRFSVTPYASGASLQLLADNVATALEGDMGIGLQASGLADVTSNMHTRACILAMTSDNRLVKINLTWNRNNSSYTIYSATKSTKFFNWFKSIGGGSDSTDPYNAGGATGPGGGGGDYRLVDDPVDFPSLPTISVADAGFVSIWVPTQAQLRNLSAFMWNSDITKIDFWKKMIANPIDLILGLQLLPFTISTELVPANVTLGLIDSGIAMNYTDTQFHDIDCGELDLSEYWGAFLDYAPYTSVEIYLPYIGVRPLNINDCMPKTIHVKYRVDIVTGSCVALIKCGSSVFYHFSGSCAAQVPVTSGQAQQLFGQALGLGIKVATAAATGGVAGALAATVGASSTVASAGGMVGADRSGSISGTAGFMDNQTPYLIITRPRQAVPEGQNDLTGYPAFITETMGDLTGYTEIQVTHLHNMTATQPEIDEIVGLLRGGVFF